ncbi:Calcium/calmodulin-dependent protein kinase type II (CaM kinase II) (Uncoordinated protein 43), partial [Durusdinium trenchii]
MNLQALSVLSAETGLEFAMPSQAAARVKELAAKAKLEDDDMIAMNKALLDVIMTGDFDTYKLLCDENLTCFEPEAKGHLVTGLDFHKYYFDLMKGDGPSAKQDVRNTSIVAPVIKWMCNNTAATV